VLDYATDSNTVAKTYTWGLDLSGDLQRAGGVGGLLCVTENPASSAQNPYYPSYDANGNISEYVDDTDSVVAHYEYSPFGKLTSSSGSKAGDFRHRFSTKYLDDETNLYYYGYRYYSSELGRWISRDPIEEIGNTLRISPKIQNIVIKADKKLNREIRSKQKEIAFLQSNGGDSPALSNELGKDIKRLHRKKAELLNNYYSGRSWDLISNIPINKKNDLNLYAFVGNSTLDEIDVLGLWEYCAGQCRRKHLVLDGVKAAKEAISRHKWDLISGAGTAIGGALVVGLVPGGQVPGAVITGAGALKSYHAVTKTMDEFEKQKNIIRGEFAGCLNECKRKYPNCKEEIRNYYNEYKP